MSQIDHVAKALEQLEIAEHANGLYHMQKATRAAQIHATLAVAEQTRLSNLIAVCLTPISDSQMDASAGNSVELFAQIRKGLGL